MRHSYRHALLVLPLLSVLSISPAVLERSQNVERERGIASIVSDYPEYDKRVEKLYLKDKKEEGKLEVDREIDIETYNKKASKLEEGIEEVKEEVLSKVKKSEKDLKKDSKELNKLVEEMFIHEEHSKLLVKNQILSSEEKKKIKEDMETQKEKLEEILDLHKARVAELRKEERKERLARTQEEKDEALCDLEDQNKVLTKQVEDLNTDYKLILLKMNLMQEQLNYSRMNQPATYAVNPYQPVQQYGQWSNYQQPQFGQYQFPSMQQQPMMPNQFQQPMQYQQPMQQQPYMNNFQMTPVQNQTMVQPMQMTPGSFGDSSFNFSA